MSDHKKTLNFTEFCDSFKAPLYQIEGSDFKCPPGYKYNKEQKQCVPKTPKDDVRKNKGDQDSRPGNGPGYNVWGSTGVNGDGYAWAEPNNWGGGGGAPEAVPYSEEYMDEAKLPRAQKRKAKKSKGTLHAYDMDETLFRDEKSRIQVKDKKGNTRRSLDNQDFNSYKRKDDEEYDFSQFRDSKFHSKAVEPNKKVIKHLKRNLKRNKPVEIITARDDFNDKEEFAKTFKRHGINIDPSKKHGVHVRRAGNLDNSIPIGDRKAQVAADSAKKKGVKRVRMYDDSDTVLRGMKTRMKQDHPDIDYKGKKVEKDDKGESRVKKYKEN